MKTTEPAFVENHEAESLGELVQDLIRKQGSVAAGNRVYLVNEIGNAVRIAEPYAIISIIEGIVGAFVFHSQEARVSISLHGLYGGMVEVNVKDDNCRNTYAVALSLQAIVPLAEQIGGQLDITNRRQTITTVSFRFFPG